MRQPEVNIIDAMAAKLVKIKSSSCKTNLRRRKKNDQMEKLEQKVSRLEAALVNQTLQLPQRCPSAMPKFQVCKTK